MGKGKWNNRLHLVAFVNSIIEHNVEEPIHLGG